METVKTLEKKESLLFDDKVLIDGRGVFLLKIETYTKDNTKNRYKVTFNNTDSSIAELVYNNDKDSAKCYSLLLENDLDSGCGFNFKNILLSTKTHRTIDTICKAIGESQNYSVKDVRLYGKGFQQKSRYFVLPLI